MGARTDTLFTPHLEAVPFALSEMNWYCGFVSNTSTRRPATSITDRYDLQERLIELSDLTAISIGTLWFPEFAALRKTERFNA